MHLLVLLAALSAPAQASVSLRWAPALDQALAGLTGPAADVVRGFDGVILAGLRIRLNEIHVLSRAKVDDLDALRRYRHRPASSLAVPADRLAALERSLSLFSPVIARLEAQGIRIDDKANASTELGPALSRALGAEARESDRRARALASRYGEERSLELAYADSVEADMLLRDRYPYLSPDALDGLARVYDSGRTPELAARRAAANAQIALVSPDESATMRDAIAAEPPSLFHRIVVRVRALASRIAAPLF